MSSRYLSIQHRPTSTATYVADFEIWSADAVLIVNSPADSEQVLHLLMLDATGSYPDPLIEYFRLAL